STAPGEAEMAQPELLEAVAEDAALSGRGESDGRGVSRSRKEIGVAETDAAGEERDEANGEVVEEEEQADEAAPVAAGDDLIDLSDFETMFTRFQTPIINFVFRLVGNREQAYDLAQ